MSAAESSSGELSVALGVVAVVSAAIAGGGFWLTASLDAFARCRTAFRMPQAVYDSLACQSYAAIMLFSLALSVVAGLVALAVAVRVCLRWSARRRGERRSSRP